jgi:GNAT superfamily N-acetyltransferase
MRIERLTPALLADYLSFFDGPAFCDNPDWAGCYCHYLYVDERVRRWDDWTAAENRAAVAARIAAGHMSGLLAFEGDTVVGWCGAGAKRRFPVFDAEPEAECAGVGAITCFVVAPDHRRRGVARALLDAALASFAADGLTIAEAYPRQAANGPAALHHGPMALFVAAGFEPYRDDPGDNSLTMRKTLTP